MRSNQSRIRSGVTSLPASNGVSHSRKIGAIKSVVGQSGDEEQIKHELLVARTRLFAGIATRLHKTMTPAELATLRIVIRYILQLQFIISATNNTFQSVDMPNDPMYNHLKDYVQTLYTIFNGSYLQSGEKFLGLTELNDIIILRELDSALATLLAGGKQIRMREYVYSKDHRSYAPAYPIITIPYNADVRDVRISSDIPPNPQDIADIIEANMLVVYYAMNVFVEAVENKWYLPPTEATIGPPTGQFAEETYLSHQFAEQMLPSIAATLLDFATLPYVALEAGVATVTPFIGKAIVELTSDEQKQRMLDIADLYGLKGIPQGQKLGVPGGAQASKKAIMNLRTLFTVMEKAGPKGEVKVIKILKEIESGKMISRDFSVLQKTLYVEKAAYESLPEKMKRLFAILDNISKKGVIINKVMLQESVGDIKAGVEAASGRIPDAIEQTSFPGMPGVTLEKFNQMIYDTVKKFTEKIFSKKAGETVSPVAEIADQIEREKGLNELKKLSIERSTLRRTGVSEMLKTGLYFGGFGVMVVAVGGAGYLAVYLYKSLHYIGGMGGDEQPGAKDYAECMKLYNEMLTYHDAHEITAPAPGVPTWGHSVEDYASYKESYVSFIDQRLKWLANNKKGVEPTVPLMPPPREPASWFRNAVNTAVTAGAILAGGYVAVAIYKEFFKPAPPTPPGRAFTL